MTNATLATAIEAAYDFHEAKLATEIQTPAPTPLDNDARRLFNHFAEWSKQRGVRHLPAKPTTVAAFLAGFVDGDPLACAEAIQLAHHGLSCPVSTDVVRFQLNSLSKIKPPRSWRADEKLLWAELPPDIRAAIARREQERDIALKRLQNRFAEFRRLADAETKNGRTENEENHDHSQA